MHEDQLQTDVMRFMAIIAFCLMAVLALVKAAPYEPTPPAPATAPEPEVELPLPDTRASILEVHTQPDTVTEPQVEEPPARIASTVEQPVARVQPTEHPAPDPAPPEPDVRDEQGLSLRFASDRDFLRLLSKGDMSLFAFDAQRVLTLDPDYRFVPAEAPHQVYEVLFATIPDAIKRRAPSDPALSWGVVLPRHTTRIIREYVDEGLTGDLSINRFGEVRYVAR
ncbi:MAG: hypothetical protein QF515_10730 [Pseudomonadales bacterium]|jgi:hypothetical protein|nr:hypothetical protein [Pseudomonadales bacterium]MDP6827568.1 hypothetical protein [Pseudomonadales bacterium]